MLNLYNHEFAFQNNYLGTCRSHADCKEPNPYCNSCDPDNCKGRCGGKDLVLLNLLVSMSFIRSFIIIELCICNFSVPC